jgi:hypothetical protein
VKRIAGGILLALCGLFMSLAAWPLDSVLNRGDSCVEISWIPDTNNTNPSWYMQNGNGCSGVDSMYRHCDFFPGNRYNGIAYSYGGEDPWYLFRQRLADGFLVGSHLCHYLVYGDPTPVVTGTDCSGFLCFIWNVGRVSTGNMVASPDYAHIDRSAIRAGDAMVRSGYHAVFVVEADDLTEAFIWEASSSVFGCRGRITDLTSSAWDPYTPLRNPQITSGGGIKKGRDIRLEVQSVNLWQVRGMLRVRSMTLPIRSIALFDPSGRQTLDAANRAQSLELTIPVKGFAPGVYTSVIRFKDKGMFTGRVLLCGP